jgi:hypothetical protein|tara:strand:+ start:1898 stop:2086 length:189 start_codon:yes stop_codon:yes gene_type:complete
MVKQGETALGDPLGVIKVGQMPTGFKRFHGLSQNLESRPFLWFPQDSVLRPPDHMKWLRGKW